MGLFCFSEKIGSQPFLRWLLYVAIFSWVVVFSEVNAAPSADEAEQICRASAELIPKRHYSARTIDGTIARRMLIAYIDSLDRRHMVFLQSDLDEFTRRYAPASDRDGTASSLAASVVRGDLTPAREIYARYLTRVSERMSRIESRLRQSPDFTVDESWALDRSQFAWPRDVAAADELWRLRLKHEWLQELLAGKAETDVAGALRASYARKWQAAQMDDRQILRRYLTALAQSYDPHSAYYSHQGQSGDGWRESRLARNEEEPVDAMVTAVLAESVAGDQRLGVVRLPTFYHGSAQAVAGAIALLRQRRPSGIVLDLRGNQGGAIDEAVKVAGLFLGTGAVARCQDRSGHVETLSASGDALCTLPLAVLVDGATASAAEIVAGALQDYNRAVIVGSETTFGKGTLQEIIPLNRVVAGFFSDLGELKVTTHQFYRVTGAPVQGRGIRADVVLPLAGRKAKRGEATLLYAIAANTVAPVYRAADSDGQVLLALRERSAQRVRESRELAHLQQVQAHSSETISLRYDKRQVELDTTRKLQSELEALPGEWWLRVISDTHEREVAARRDCILEETAAILWDSIELRSFTPNLLAAQTP